jgi:hypothetical protein
MGRGGVPSPAGRTLPQYQPPLCAGCRAREARYGFRPEGVDAAAFDRPRTLCFDCFRVELTARQLVRERMARVERQQVGMPLEDTLRALDKRAAVRRSQRATPGQRGARKTRAVARKDTARERRAGGKLRVAVTSPACPRERSPRRPAP